jgi:hypothetical protein
MRQSPKEGRQMKLSGSILAAAAIAALALPVTAPASGGGGGGVTSAGKCIGMSTSKIKAKPRDGRLEVEFEVDQNRNGVKWNVKLKHNGAVAFRTTATTHAPSGSFTVEHKLNDAAGKDSVAGIARNPSSGERCVARVTV